MRQRSKILHKAIASQVAVHLSRPLLSGCVEPNLLGGQSAKGENTVDQDQKRLEEWKERYASYRQYRTHYLATVTVIGTAWVLGLVLAMQRGTAWHVKVLTCFLVTVVVAGFYAAHVIFRPAIRELGERIKQLEGQLELGEFDTTRPLETLLLVSQVVAGVALVATIIILILSMLGLV